MTSGITPISAGGGPAWNTQEPERGGPLAPYVRAMRSHLPLVLAIWLAVILGSLVGVLLRSEVYQASAQLVVTPVPADNSSFLGVPVVHDSGDPTRTLQTAATLVDSHEAAAEAARRIGGDWTPEKVIQAIDVQPVGESSIVAVQAQTDDPEAAARLANTFASSVIDVRSRALRRAAADAIANTRAQLAEPGLPASLSADLSQRLSDLRTVSDGTDPTLSISQQASVPLGAENAPGWLVILLGILAGGVLATGAALILELFTPQKVSSESELLSIYPLPVLARLPATRRGRLPVAGPYAAEAYRFVQAQLEHGGGLPRSVLFTSPSRGDGNTSTLVGFARELADAGRTAIMVDLDLRRPGLAAALGVVELAHDVRAARTGRGRLEQALSEVPGSPNLKLAGAFQPDRGALFERAMPQLLAEGLQSADYVLLDTPPLGEVSDALPAVDAVDDVVIVVRLGKTRPVSLRTMRELLERMGKTVTGYIVIGADQPVAGGYRYAIPWRAPVQEPRTQRNGADPTEERRAERRQRPASSRTRRGPAKK